MGVTKLLQYAHDVVDEMFAAPHRYAENLVELGQADNDGGSIGKTDDDRMGEKVDDHPKFEKAEQKLNAADQEGEQDGQGNELIRADSGKWRQRRCGQQRNHRHWAGGKLGRGAPHGGDHHWQERGIQAVVGRQASQLSISHGLRDKHQCNSEARDQVCLDILPAGWKPAQERQKTSDLIHGAYPGSDGLFRLILANS